MKERPCEAEYHVAECPCPSCRRRHCDRCPDATVDHFTPKSIGRKVLGWGQKKLCSPENLQYLSRACHAEKDRTTSDRLTALQSGQEITLDTVRRWADKSIYNR